MKTRITFLIGAVAVAVLSGCASTRTIEQTGTQVKVNKYEPVTAQSAPLTVPDWYMNSPQQTEQSVFTAGQATSNDLSMAMQKAMLDADTKLAFQIESQVKALMKSYTFDRGNDTVQNAQLLAKKLANVTIQGHHQVDSRITQEGSKFRVFILMRYPLGDANKFLKQATGRTLADEARVRERETNQELEAATAPKVPVTQPVPDVAPSQKVNVTDSNGDTQTVEMLPISDAKVKAKREEALNKPGAVYGQMTVPM